MQRIEELTRLQRLHDALPEVRAQHELLSRRLDAMLAPIEDAEQALLETADKVVTLSAERLAQLGERTRELLSRLELSEREWAGAKYRYADEEARLAAKAAEYEKLRVERDQRVAALQAYASIDRKLLDQLAATGDESGMVHVRSMLAEASAVLERVDNGLRDALERYDRMIAEQRQELPWRDSEGKDTS
jgi:hypothetical protein